MNQRKRLSLLGSLVTMLALGGLLAAAPRALAAKPETVTVPTDFSFVDDTSCGFPVETHVTGFVRFIVFRDENGNVTRQINSFHQQLTFTNLDTGKSVTSPSVGPDILYFQEDGSLTVVVLGIVSRIIVPDQGVVNLNVGRAVISFPAEGAPEVLFLAGPKDDLFPALCDLLS
jgi:hypothetical protein